MNQTSTSNSQPESEKVRVVVDGTEEHYIDSMPLGVIVHDGHLNIEVPDRFQINPERTVQLIAQMGEDEWDATRKDVTFLHLWSQVWGDVLPPENLKHASLACKHIAGMILLMAEALATKKHIFMQMPETYLHPKQCANLVTLILEFKNPSNWPR